MFLSVLLVASVDRAEVTVEHPELAFRIPAIFGKPATPTPEGLFLVTRGYSKQLDMRLLIFRRENGAVWAIHPNLPYRAKQIRSTTSTDNFLSDGCIGVEQKVFDKLWAIKQPMVLQVYGGGIRSASTRR
jgi:hypothetical protein